LDVVRGHVVLRLIPVVLLLAGCTERRLFVRTDPPNANVRVNGKRVGLSPVGWRFDHYGKVLVEVDRDGYQAEQRVVDLDAPWWQWPGADFLTDVLWPGTLRYDQVVSIALEPLPPRDDAQVEREFEELAEAAARVRAEVERDGEGEDATAPESAPAADPYGS